MQATRGTAKEFLAGCYLYDIHRVRHPMPRPDSADHHPGAELGNLGVEAVVPAGREGRPLGMKAPEFVRFSDSQSCRTNLRVVRVGAT